MINEIARLGVTCPMCGGDNLEQTEDTPDAHKFLMDGGAWLCLDCQKRDRSASLNIFFAKEGQMPPTCDGCEHHRLGPQSLFDTPTSSTVYGPIRINATREPARNLCTLFRRDLGSAVDNTKPLTRMCFTWES